jgi:ribonucleoside-diphosphate reductase alpha chain
MTRKTLSRSSIERAGQILIDSDLFGKGAEASVLYAGDTLLTHTVPKVSKDIAVSPAAAPREIHDPEPRVVNTVKPSSLLPQPAFTPNALRVLERRYLKRDKEGKVCETTEEMLWRVASNIAQVEQVFNKSADSEKYARTFYEIIARLEFVPNSPTLMNAGRELQQLSACFVLPIDDSINSIFETVKSAALIHKSGGGTGFSFSRLRPKDDIVSTSHGRSSGPISFMKVFNEATEAINQGGFRRGANMGILNYDHPDIIEFITAKVNEHALNNFNISVGITEEFMRLVEKDQSYDLVNPRTRKINKPVRAREVFDLIVDMAWRSGEPGIVFIDRLNKANPTPQVGQIESTNPCGEQPLLPYESCNLGSINLAKMITAAREVNYPRLKEIVHLAVRFLDNVIEANNYPLPQIEAMTKANRKIGLGIMGFADMLIQLGIPYNSEEALQTAEKAMKFILDEGREASRILAQERGHFPNYQKSTYYLNHHPPIRNATLTTIAPTGTISIIAGCSSGIEPLFAVCFMRNVLDGDQLIEVHPLFETLAKEEGFYSEALMKRISRQTGIQDITEIPARLRRLFVTAHDIDPAWHIRMQSVFQQYTDNAVSKTINFHKEATKDDVKKAYFLAYQLGCKGVTVYRDGCRSEQVLTTVESQSKQPQEPAPSDKMTGPEFTPAPRPRPELTYGTTRKMKTGCGTLYVTINYDEAGKPFELFSTMGKAGGCAASQTEALSRLISFALRSGAQPREIVKQLKGISCHSVSWGKSGKILSCADAIAKALETALENGTIKPPASPAKSTSESPPKHPFQAALLKKGACPECGGILSYEEGCVICHACGYSECG